jgi:SMP-30/Gluconolactonase/LRE-like region
MKSRWIGLIVFLSFTAVSLSFTFADDDRRQFPKNVHFTTRAITPFAIEGLTGDATHNLYTTGRTPAGGPQKCPVWRIRPNGSRRAVGFIPAGCGAAGITFDSVGNLYIADSAIINGVAGNVWKLSPDPKGCASDDSTSDACSAIATSNASSPTTPFAKAVPGTNGLAFDQDGNLWTSDGVTGQGRVWKITGPGADCTLGAEINCTEAFRIQPMAATNVEIGLSFPASTFGSGVTSVGRDVRTLPPGTIDTARNFSDNPATGRSQPLVANGLAFNKKGDLFNIDTARGALWKVEFDRHGNLKSPTGCDPAFTANTLCLSNVFVAHPILEGGDGIALDRAGNVWVDANERNAIAVVTEDGKVFEIFRNEPDATTHLLNGGPLEFPTSPFLLGKTFCTSNSDGNRRDNSPQIGGEINAGAAFVQPPGIDPGKRGKISCMDEELKIPGLRLPVD